METINVEVWVLVDHEGEVCVDNDEQRVREIYEKDIGPLNECGGFRLLKVTLTVPLPQVVKLAGEVPTDAGMTTESITMKVS